jgi:hypothetical protein
MGTWNMRIIRSTLISLHFYHNPSITPQVTGHGPNNSQGPDSHLIFLIVLNLARKEIPPLYVSRTRRGDGDQERYENNKGNPSDAIRMRITDQT